MEEIRWHLGQVSAEDRRKLLGHGSACIWLTGLPASGKSTLACALERRLWERGILATVLDGDNVRHGLCAGLSFSPKDRTENLRRSAHAARLLQDAGAIVIGAFVSPTLADRAQVAAISGPAFLLVHVATPPQTCEARDGKGLWARARRGEIPDFTGVSAPYEAPTDPALRLDLGALGLPAAVRALETLLANRGITPPPPPEPP